MIKGCCCGFFCSLLFQKRDHPRRELNSIHCQGLIVYIQQLHSGFPAVLLLLLMGGGDAVSPQQKNRTAQKKARQTANALTMGALKSLFASLLLKAICVGVHTLVCDAWNGLCYESYSNSNWMPNYKIIAQSKQMPWKSL